MKRVLICEDEPLIAADLEQMVYDAGHDPAGPARTFGEALELAEIWKPAIAVIDLNLADGVTGAAVARALAERGTRIIILSSVTDVIPVLAGIPHVFMTKPVNPEAMGAILSMESKPEPVPPAPPSELFTPSAAA